MVPTVVPTSDLPPLIGPRGAIPGRQLFEGIRFGLQHLSFIFGETAPGQGIALHSHDYEEAIIVHSGTGTYTVGESTIEAGPGDVVIIPSQIPHRFVNRAQEPLQHTAVHSSGTFELQYQD